MDYEQAVGFLDAHIGMGMQPGLERIRTLMEMMGDPQTAYPIIHITGSNGKTSVSRMATSLLVSHGLRVGTFVSPHLEVVEERLALDGVAASPDEFAQAVHDLVPFVEIFESRSDVRPTYFELTAALAYSYFAANAVDVAVVEVGLGGRLDATNVGDGAVAVLTGISLEHTAWLGNSIEEIAAEKLAIAKPGSVLVTGRLPEEVLPMAVARAADLDIGHRRFGAEFHPEFVTMAVGGWSGTVSGVYETYDDLYLPVHGRHQFDNLSVAVAAVEELTGRPLDPDAVRQGAAAVTAPGRLEVIRSEPLLVIDGAHNPDAFARLGESLVTEFPPADWILVIGAMSDKDLDTMLSHLRGSVARVVATAVDYERATPTDRVAEVAARVLGVPVDTAASVPEAVARARDLAGKDGAVLVTGSLYIVGEARTALVDTH